MSRRRVLELIIDGFGYDPNREVEILEAAYEAAPADLKQDLQASILQPLIEQNPALTPKLAFIHAFNRNPLNLHFHAKYRDLVNPDRAAGPPVDDELLYDLKDNHDDLADAIENIICNIARDKHYAVWAARTPAIDELRLSYPCVSTQACGINAGYEDLTPEVQGNSETGHQQLGNLTVAPQIPLQVAIDIENGAFAANPTLNEAIEEAIKRKSNLNVTFMVSGEYGDDGRVHSCWNHLESFLEIVFEKHEFDPGKFRIQAILDGRDAPLTSSVEAKGDRYGFLQKLDALVRRFGADDCVAWVIGRGLAMDRDYEEKRTRTDYELLTAAQGVEADNLAQAIEMVKESHARKVYDPFIEPIAVKDRAGRIRRIEPGDVLVDLNFRADRQRARIAALLGAVDFLQGEAGKKGKTWQLDWLRPELDLAVYCLTEYHPALQKAGAKIAYAIGPQPHNFLSLLSAYFKQRQEPFKYLLVAESTKAVHMGYFIRGRREENEIPETEARFIVPSYADDHGIKTDDDYWKTPQMKAFEIGGKLLNELALGVYDLAIVNFSNPDMLGHLVTQRFEENVRALEIIDQIVEAIVTFVLPEGYDVIITADHGNVDDYSSSHSLNPVVTTFISLDDEIRIKKDLNESIRLFDIPWAIAEILGVAEDISQAMPAVPAWIGEKGLCGKVPIELAAETTGEA